MLRTIPLLPLLLLAPALFAQTQPFIEANGSATINVNPDQAQLTVSVTTQAATAQAAADQNSTATNAVIDALKAALGTAGKIQTVGYSVSPIYDTKSAITGYSVTNSLLVTTTDLTLPGALIDAANKAGATNVGGLAFGLKDADPVRQQALAQASKQALAHAAAIASGLGAKTGALLSAQEASSSMPYTGTAAGAAATTPILTGTVSVTASVMVTVQLVQ